MAIMNTYKWNLLGTIQKGQYYDDDTYDYWIDGQVDDHFEGILKQIGTGKRVKITIQTCEVK